jgi:8-oxo-dGTP pyrophosphatase MutT (NUDIX family)
MRRAIQLIYRARRLLMAALRLRTRGVKVMLFNPDGELLLVRNSYGRSDHFLLPGGGIGPFESPAAAAAREIREEVGLTVGQLTFRSSYASGAEGRRDVVILFSAVAEGEPVADGVEVEEARFFALDALPATTSPATLRRIAEHRGQKEVDGSW